MKDLIDIKRMIDRLGKENLKSCLGLVLMQVTLLKEQKVSHEQAVAALMELYDQLTEYEEKKTFWDPGPGCSHVHIVTGDSFAGSMKQALKELGWAETHKIVTLGEHYAIGPVNGLDSQEGRKMRSDWFRDNISGAFEMYEDVEEEYRDLLHKLEQIPEQAEVIVWTSRSVREQVGMRHALYLLRRTSNTVRVCDACAVCEELYNRPDASIEYRRSGEITPIKLREALMRTNGSGKLAAEPIARFAKEWQVITEQRGILRIWQNGAVREVPADYYDQYMLEKLDQLRPPGGGREFLKSARLIGEAIGHCDQDIGDSYFEYRLRELIYQGVLEIKGVPAGMRFYSVRRKHR